MKGKIIIIVVLFASVLLYIIMDKEPEPPKIFRVKYEVTGRGHSPMISYTNSQGGFEQKVRVQLPWYWEERFTLDSPQYLMMYLSAQNDNSDTYIITSIYINDNLYKTSTSSGPYAVASIDGSGFFKP